MPPNWNHGFPIAVYTATTPTSYHVFLHTAPGTPVSVFLSDPRTCELQLELPVPLDLVEEDVLWHVDDLIEFSQFTIALSFLQDVDPGGIRSRMNGEGTCEIELAKLVRAKELLHLTIK